MSGSFPSPYMCVYIYTHFFSSQRDKYGFHLGHPAHPYFTRTYNFPSRDKAGTSWDKPGQIVGER